MQKLRYKTHGLEELQNIKINVKVLRTCNLKLNDYYVIRLLIVFVSKSNISYMLNLTYPAIMKIENKLIERGLLYKTIVKKGITKYSNQTAFYEYGNQYYFLTEKLQI